MEEHLAEPKKEFQENTRNKPEGEQKPFLLPEAMEEAMGGGKEYRTTKGKMNIPMMSSSKITVL